MNLKDKKNVWIITDLIIVAFIFLFLLSYFEPQYLLSKTTITGGDTGSHYYTALYLRDYLLPHGKISGWCHGNLCGFPILQYYFPLPFLIMAILSYLIPLQIAFKIVTVLGTFLLPVSTYLFFRFLRQPFPVPIMGALFSLPFLFMEGNVMWGGNIPSTLAGEFCFNIGFALAVLWLGLLYRTISEQRRTPGCSILLALVGFCHGYTLLFAVFSSLFFLFTANNFGQNLKKLLQIHIIAFFMMAFWLVPLLAFLPYTTRFNILWIFFDWKQVSREIFPVILYPAIGLTLLGTAAIFIKKTMAHFQASLKPWAYLWFMILSGLALFAIGYRIGLVDIRFLPFFQFFLVIGGAMLFSLVSLPQKASILVALIVMLSAFLWVNDQEAFISKWIKSNYTGFENKQLWNAFSSINRFLKGSAQDPRVVYEHSMLHSRAGTVRAFESTPLFSGRSTLEGLYIQASPCSPFVFYIQSEISQRPSTPIPDYNYSRFNLKRGIEHLKLFNTQHFIVAELKTKKAVKRSPQLKFRYRSGPYEVYELVTNSNRYVEPLKYKPIVAKRKQWRRLSYRWFRLSDLSVPIVFKDKIESEDYCRFNMTSSIDFKHLTKERIETAMPLKETVSEEEILVEGAPIGKPLLVKVSYHPNWKVEGAENIYLVSPAFMLIYPTSSTVRLYYGRTWPDYVGASMTCLIIIVIIFSSIYDFKIIPSRLSRGLNLYGVKVTAVSMILCLLAIPCYLIWFSPEFPILRYNKGLTYFTKGDYATARRYFMQVLKRHPQTLIVDQAGYHHAMCFFREKDWSNTIRSLDWLIETYPETGRAAEAFYHIGLCYLNLGKTEKAREKFKETIKRFPGTMWARLAKDRLGEIGKS